MATYTVRAGDSISKIARDLLGDITRWPEIARLNGLTAPYIIFPEQVLQMPAVAAGARVLTAPGEVSLPRAWWTSPWLWLGLATAGGLWWWRRRRR